MTRIGIGGLWHETNSFSPFTTGLDQFKAYQYFAGTPMLDAARDTNTEVGGALDEAERLRLQLVPLHYAAAVPSGVVTHDAYAELVRLQVEALTSAGELDALLLVLHGAMVVEGVDDPEADFVRHCRAVVGDIPLAATLDLHANLGDDLCAGCDVLVGYDTFPHVDMAERGAEAVGLLARMLDIQQQPRHAHVKLPLLTAPQMQATSDEPLRSITDLMHKLENGAQVWSASILPGYPYSDVTRLGVSVYVCGEHPVQAAAELASSIWARRDEFQPDLVTVDKAIAALDGLDGRVALVDVADNVGGGSPGNGTVILEALARRARRDSLAVIWDPPAIERLYSGAGQTELKVGTAADPMGMGPPVTVNGPARLCGDLTYVRTGRYMSGQRVAMGRCAVQSYSGGDILLTERRVMPFDEDHLRSAGLNPQDYAVLVVKSASAWRGAVGQYVQHALYVRAPGYCPSELDGLAYTRRPQPVYPLEKRMTWSPSLTP